MERPTHLFLKGLSMPPPRKLVASVLVALGLLASAIPAQAVPLLDPGTPSTAQSPATLDLELLDALDLAAMMDSGELTSVQLTQAYIDRIEALNKRGPGLNAVTQLNQLALEEAARLDAERASGTVRSPGHGLPVLLKDLIDVEGMYTSNGNFSLRNSFPAEDSGVVKKLRASGAVILGKVGLSEWANSFGSQPSGFANLTGQVVNALDADQNPSGSSSGSGAAGAAALAALVIGTETSGSIISPATAQSLVGIRPTVGLVPAYGIGPISASQDTAGPMDRTVASAALNLQMTAGRDLKNEAGYEDIFGPNWRESITPAPDEIPDYLSALDVEFVRGKRVGYNGTFTPGTPAARAFDALVAAGAVMVERPQIAVGSVPALPPGYQQHRTINSYYANLGPNAPIKSLAEEVAANQAESQQALKFGHQNHVNSLAADISPGGANEVAYRSAMPIRRAAQWAAIDRMMTNDTPDDPSDDFLAILGSVPSGATAGTPQITIPMGYNPATRRAVGVSIHGNRLSERNLIGVAYVIEQGTKLRRPVSELNPSMYRCAKTIPAPPFAARGGCNPDFDSVMAILGGKGVRLPFDLENETVEGLQARMGARSLSAVNLTRAYLTRIALANAAGPAVQAVRAINPQALEQAKTLDLERNAKKVRGPLHGIPVLLDDSIDVAGMPTTGGSIALQNSLPAKDSTIAARLKAAGAIILGKTNVTELNALVDTGMPEGYSSLGGQVMLPSDTDKPPAGSSGGSAAAAAAGLAALSIGMETSPDSAQLIAPAGVAGVVGLKPTVGLVSRAGVLPAAKSQDSPGPIARSVRDAALQLQAIAGPDPADPATTSASVPNFLAGLTTDALSGKRVAVISSTAVTYPGAVAAIEQLGGITTTRSVGTPSPNPPSVVQREFQRDLDTYLGTTTGSGPKTLAGIIAYNLENPVEGLKYQQGELDSAAAVDLGDSDTAAAYLADLANGQASHRALIDGILNNGTPDDASDDLDVVAVPSGNALVGIAARAGYPVLTVPAGYGTGNAGRNPVGVTFIGTAFSEATLLSIGFAFEQGTKVRLAPSFTNPSMWRCVPGSNFFTGEKCNTGDPLLTLPGDFFLPAAPIAAPGKPTKK
jgi:amidase